jgi:FAD/FMN-containing dehydrogenase
MLTVKGHNLQICPEDTAEVARLVRFAGKRRLLVVPVNRGHSLEDIPLGRRNRIILNLSHLDRVLDFSPEDFFITLQAGYRVSQLNRKLKSFGLFFPFSHPNLSESAASLISKSLSAEFGGQKLEVKKFTLALEVVTASGEIVNTGRVTFKNVVGYDLVRLFCGSWGRLGIITAVTLRLLPFSRLREYGGLRFLEPKIPSVEKMQAPAKRELSQRIKTMFDPSGIFLCLPS